jgi:hypothetical protein
MTDHTDDDFFDDAKSEFPDKEDLKDRLVAIFAIGPVGQRKSEASGKPYDYVETVTVVLDDGPDGNRYSELVGPVGGIQPVVLSGFQWSASGVVARVKPRVGTDLELRALVGRINSMPNKRKGFSDAWSIAEPTDADKDIVRGFKVSLLKVRDDILAARRRDDELEPVF